MLPKSTTLIIAVTAIFIGVFLLLGNMGVISNQLMAIWPIILVVAGLVGLICSDPEKRSILPRRGSKKKR